MKTLSFTFSIILFISFFSTLNAQNGTSNTLEALISTENLAIINKHTPPHLQISNTGQIVQNTARGSTYLLDSIHEFDWNDLNSNWEMFLRQKMITYSPEGYLLEQERQIRNSVTGIFETIGYTYYTYNNADGSSYQELNLNWNGVAWDTLSIINVEINNADYLTLYEAYLYDLTTSEWIPGLKIEHTYNNLDQMTSHKQYGTSPTNTWLIGYFGSYTYNSNSQLESFTAHYDWNVTTNRWEYMDRDSFFFDTNNDLTLKKNYDWDEINLVWILEFQTFITVDANDNIIHENAQALDDNQIWVNVGKVARIFNASNQETRLVRERWDPSSSQWLLASKIEHTYNNNGDETLFEIFSRENGAWESDIQNITIYDVNGQLSQMESVSYDSNGNVLSGYYAIDYFYSLHTVTTNTQTIQDQSIKVYPNPTTGIVQVDLPLDFSQGQVMIFDMQGKLLKSESYQNNTIDFSIFNNGLYLLQFINEEKRYTLKIIKN